ncbi:fimbrial protein [Serratia fonticola]|uniref:fimbrial protein n=1 Tax=Serratia fonticola TaxID=47917 RepID=UPI0016475CB0|nr:fimbrial protein [Serratia fonticola]MBC3227942.1 fimbrial protein [Serratia fonticola]
MKKEINLIVHWAIKLSTLLFSTFFALSTYAACQFSSGFGLQSHKLTISPGNIFEARNKTIGSVLGSGEVAAVNGTYARCTGTNTYVYNINSTNGVTVAGLTNVFPSNIPGIGLRFYLRDNAGKSYRFVNQGTGTGSTSSNSWGWYQNGNAFWGVDIIVTGPIDSGIYNGSLMATFRLGTLNVLNVQVNPFTVTSSSCDATTTQSMVELGSQPAQAFPAQGSSAGQKDFSIELRGCPASGISSIDYTLTPLNTIIDASQAVMGINAIEGAAKGIGIKIMDGMGNPVKFDTATRIVYTTGASAISIPFKAAFYRTTTQQVTAGVVRAPLVFTMTYK